MNSFIDHPEKVQICYLWTHQENFSNEPVILDLTKFAVLDLKPDSLAKIVKFTQNNPSLERTGTPGFSASLASIHNVRNAGAHKSAVIAYNESGARVHIKKSLEYQSGIVFKVKCLPDSIRSRNKNLKISLLESIATLFGFRRGMQVVVYSVDREKYTLSHIEITFRDQFLTRADTWRMVLSEFSDRVVYKNQKVVFMGTIKVWVKNVFISGQKCSSGYFSSATIPIFRSESSRFLLLLQMSKEIWDFDSEGSGEIMFNQVTNEFLPELFRHWMSINARHLVSIVMFTRLVYNQQDDDSSSATSTTGYRDFYRVVSTNMISDDWINILYRLKREFRTFLQDVSVMRCDILNDICEGDRQNPTQKNASEYVVAGYPTSAIHGNILEAINMASVHFYQDYLDWDLMRNGFSMLVITAGSGVFDVDYSQLKLTTDTLINNGIGVDMVCFSPVPLHSVPLLRFRCPRIAGGSDNINATYDYESYPAGEYCYAIPQWINVSFWRKSAYEETSSFQYHLFTQCPWTKSKRESCFQPRCRMYELQMMGLMENEMNDAHIKSLGQHSGFPEELLSGELMNMTPESRGDIMRRFMKCYDSTVFQFREPNLTFDDQVKSENSRYPLRGKYNVWDEIELREKDDKINMGDELASSWITVNSGIGSSEAYSGYRPLGFISRSVQRNKLLSGCQVSLNLEMVSKMSLPTQRERDNDSTEKALCLTRRLQGTLGRPKVQGSLSKILKHGTWYIQKYGGLGQMATLLGQLSDGSKGIMPLIRGRKTENLYKIKPGQIKIEASMVTPRYMNPLDGLKPWLVFVNPCNPPRKFIAGVGQVSPWKHVYPRNIWISRVRWKSLCKPAALPLTADFFPTPQHLERVFDKLSYDVILGSRLKAEWLRRESGVLIRELICCRLAHGFLFIQPESVLEQIRESAGNATGPFTRPEQMKSGNTIWMAHANAIHKLVYQSSSMVNVTSYIRKATAPLDSRDDQGGNDGRMKSYIRSLLSREYQLRSIVIQQPLSRPDWQIIDRYLAGYLGEFSKGIKFRKAKFVLIPQERKSEGEQDKKNLADIDIHMEGIHRLTQLWYNSRSSMYERSSLTEAEELGSARIAYHTLDTCTVLANVKDLALESDEYEINNKDNRGMEKERKFTRDIDIKVLAAHLQGEGGIEIADRRWLELTYRRSFVGFDLTNWLLERFSDIKTRRQAVEYARDLMAKGMFVHALRKYPFYDGIYYYQLKSIYQTKRCQSQDGKLAKGSENRLSGKAKVVEEPVKLSAALHWDLDTRKRSDRPEFINLHFGRLYNPYTCYHFQIEWLSVTAKLMEDHLSHWAELAEKWNLKLVQVPLVELRNMMSLYPLRSPYLIKLAEEPPECGDDMLHRPGDKFVYHRAILAHLGYILETPGESDFKVDIKVEYTWERPRFKLNQYIHRSGHSLCQITEEGNFILAANLLCQSFGHAYRDGNGKFSVNPSKSGGVSGAVGEHEKKMMQKFQEENFNWGNPVESYPLTGFVPSLLYRAEREKDETRYFCHNVEELRKLYAAESGRRREALRVAKALGRGQFDVLKCRNRHEQNDQEEYSDTYIAWNELYEGEHYDFTCEV